MPATAQKTKTVRRRRTTRARTSTRSRLTGPGRYIGVSAASAKRRRIRRCNPAKSRPCGRRCIPKGRSCPVVLYVVAGKRTHIRRKTATRRRPARK
jgi:hypothetical protein